VPEPDRRSRVGDCCGKSVGEGFVRKGFIPLAEHPQHPRLVLVEDEWLVRMEMADALADAGFEVVEFSSGEGAIEWLTGGGQPDLLISDIRLTGPATGWDVADAYRALLPRLPVVYASANPCEDARMAEGSVFLDKPARTDELVATCRRLLA
jgi:CheY-like chemotaxis protein